jgi:hypothetical protein
MMLAGDDAAPDDDAARVSGGRRGHPQPRSGEGESRAIGSDEEERCQ